jgi:hypothetical protein
VNIESPVRERKPALRGLLALGLTMAMLVPAGSTLAQDETAASSGPPATEAPATAVEIPAVETGFGEYALIPLLGDDAPYAGPATPTTLDDVTMSDEVAGLLSDEARARLAEQGFVVVPEEFRLFHHAYDWQLYTSTPVFVTTDAAYHAWHQVFDKTLRDLETQELAPALETLLAGMRKNASTQRKALAGTPLEEDAMRVVDLLAVASAALAGGEDVKLSQRARAEKALIDAHTESTESPILGSVTDYSLFTPRGHYTRSQALTRYFVALSVLGQTAFRLPGSVQTDETVVADADDLRLALLASRTLVGDEELEQLWRDIFEPTAFLVGVGDDYTPFELAAAVEETVPGGMEEPLTAADDETLFAVADALIASRPVRIDPERPSVRLMGTRFVIDSWILDQMVRPNVGTQDEPRLLASPLDLAAAFGSGFALAIQDEAGETAYVGYPEQMEAMRTAVAARPDEAWGQTVYDAWLAAVEPMWLPHGAAFPDFMRTSAWDTKAQQTGFGSYAELKHDTILYTKQAVAELGAAEPPPPPARHWVEPDPVPFGRLAAMARLTRDGLADRDLLSPDSQKLLSDYVRFAERLEAIAADELAGTPITEEDDEWLRIIGGVLEGFWWRSGDKLASNNPIRDDDAAVIADIMRGIDLDSGVDQVLEIGTGRIDRIFVLMPDDAGAFHVATGGVYSYYEFPWPTEDRLTDEQWWEMLRDGEAPDRPAWQEPLFP